MYKERIVKITHAEKCHCNIGPARGQLLGAAVKHVMLESTPNTSAKSVPSIDKFSLIEASIHSAQPKSGVSLDRPGFLVDTLADRANC